MNDSIRRNMALFPMGIVMKLTQLTARQIRYYEQHGLISPQRTPGKQRLFSFRDVDRLLEIKALLEQGLNIAGIKQVLLADSSQLQAKVTTDRKEKRRELSERELRQLVKQQIIHSGSSPLSETPLNRGELSRFFH